MYDICQRVGGVVSIVNCICARNPDEDFQITQCWWSEHVEYRFQLVSILLQICELHAAPMMVINVVNIEYIAPTHTHPPSSSTLDATVNHRYIHTHDTHHMDTIAIHHQRHSHSQHLQQNADC